MADWDAITHARLIIECPNDGSALMELMTAEGAHIFTRAADTWREEWIGDHDARAVSPTPEGDTQHRRYALACPICSYRKVLRAETMQEVLHPILLACHATKATYHVSDLDALLRRVARTKAD